jgi:hypothetical protein
VSAVLLPAGVLLAVLVAVVLGLGGVSLVANRLPNVTEVMVVLVIASTGVLGGLVWLLMPTPGPPRFVDPAAVPGTYGPPPAGWTGVPQ